MPLCPIGLLNKATFKGLTMHQHQQTIADLERLEDPSTLEISVYFVALILGLAAFFLFFFSF